MWAYSHVRLYLLLSFVELSITACSLFPPAGSTPNIILFIGDGMQLEHEIAASRYLYGIDYGLSWHEFPQQLYVATWDVTAYDAYAADRGKAPYGETSFDPVIGYDPDLTAGGSAPYPIFLDGSSSYFLRAATDSASSATAYATGTKTDTGNIAWERGDPPCGRLRSIIQDLRRYRSTSIGVITTVPFNHATPAAFTSHNTSRMNYEAIANEMITATRPDILVGGGHPDWCTTYFSLTDLANLRANAGYRVVERVVGQDGASTIMDTALHLAPGEKLFGLFGSSNGDFDPPVPHDDPGFPAFDVVDENPSLAEMVETALTVLSRNPDGFFLLAEEGDIDHANHANDYSMMIGTMWRLEEAVKAAKAYVDRPDDHIDWGNTLLIVTADHANSLMRLTASPPLGMGDLPSQVGGTPWIYSIDEVTYGTTGHTNELVTLYATGANALLFENHAGIRYPGTRIIDNSEVYSVMHEAVGLR